jgi:biopolymer transport protein ExbB
MLRRDLVVVGALTAVAPLLGLLGTVFGMIHTFDAVATISGNTGTRVAAGISQALITTQFGLVVAVPGVFGLARLRRMLRNAQGVMAQCRSHALQILASQS